MIHRYSNVSRWERTHWSLSFVFFCILCRCLCLIRIYIRHSWVDGTTITAHIEHITTQTNRVIQFLSRLIFMRARNSFDAAVNDQKYETIQYDSDKQIGGFINSFEYFTTEGITTEHHLCRMNAKTLSTCQARLEPASSVSTSRILGKIKWCYVCLVATDWRLCSTGSCSSSFRVFRFI